MEFVQYQQLIHGLQLCMGKMVLFSSCATGLSMYKQWRLMPFYGISLSQLQVMLITGELLMFFTGHLN